MRRTSLTATLCGVALCSLALAACKRSSLQTSAGVPDLSLSGAGLGSLTQTGKSATELDYTLDFSNVQIGETRALTLSLTNTGVSDYQVLSVSGPSDPEYTQTGLVDGTDVAAVGVPVVVQFKPFTAGVKTDKITIGTNSTRVPTIVVSLTGTGVKLDVTVVPPALDYGNVVINTTLTKSVVVTNQGALDLTIDPFHVIGNAASLFTLKGYDSTQTQPLKAGASVTLAVQFAPVLPSTSDYTAAFVLNFCQGCQPATVSLRGTGVSSGLAITPDPLDFGFVPVGRQVTQAITVQNVANQAISINSVNLNDTTGAFGAGSAFPQPPILLGPGQSSVFNLTFDPPTSIPYNALLQLVTTDSLSNPSIPLTGFGGGPQISCQPAALDFGTVAVAAPVTQQVYCTNVGTDVLDASNNPIPAAELQIAAAGITLAGSAAYSAHLDQPSMGLTAGQTAAIDVTYAATAAGMDQGTLTIASNDTVNPSVPVALTGQAISLPPCGFTVSPASLVFGDVASGQTGLLAFTVTNTGANECLLSGLALGPSTDPAFSLRDYPQGLSSLRLGPAGNTNHEPSALTVAVKFSPVLQGTFTGAVEFTLSNPMHPQQTVSLSGSSAPGCLLIAPNDIDFGVVGFNTQNNRWCSTSSRTLNVYNQCNYDVHLTSMTQADATDFTVTSFPNVFPYDVPPQSNFKFQVQFTPAAAGRKFGSMLVQTQELAAPYLVDFNGNAETGVPQTDTFTQSQSPKVDILFVLDTDDNGAVEQVVAQNLPAFMNFAINQGIDFHIGVTTSDDCSLEQGKLDPCNTNCAVAGNAPLIVTPQTQFHGRTDPGGALSDLINQIAAGNSFGCGDDMFQPAYLALTPPVSTGWNAGFLRNDAYLAIIGVDDGDDSSPQSNDFYYNFFEGLKGFQNASAFSFNAVDALPTDPSGGCGPVFYDGPGIRIQDMATRTGGLDIDICTQQWGQALTQLGAIAFGSRRSFPLTSTPADPTQIAVQLCVNPQNPTTCVPIPANDAAHNLVNWAYDPTTNAVIFDPSDVPLPGQSVVITYPVECQ